MSHVQSTVDAILALPDGERITFARAFRDSFMWNEDEQESPPDPHFVSRQNGHPLESLLPLGVLLDRAAAYTYLTRDLHFQIGKAAFDKRLRGKEFLERVGRRIVTVSRRNLFTMAEVRCFFGYNSRVELPDKLKKVLR